MSKHENLIGKRFGLLTVVNKSDSKNGCAIWECRCDCGNTTKARTSVLLSGHKQFCERCQSKLRGTTWKSDNRIYKAWRHMLQRCENANDKFFACYGGRGIKVCTEWHNYEAFLEWSLNNGYAENLTIDRINVNGDYSPDNCRWATQKEQQNNKTNNCLLTLNGVTKTKRQWSEETGIGYTTICKRLLLGWTVERALTEPVK